MQYTRAQYMSGEVTHQQYYGQFVSDVTIKIVAQAFGGDALRAAFAEDQAFNTLELRRWDSLTEWIKHEMSQLLRDAGDFWTLANGVCVLKQAARMYVESSAEAAEKGKFRIEGGKIVIAPKEE